LRRGTVPPGGLASRAACNVTKFATKQFPPPWGSLQTATRRFGRSERPIPYRSTMEAVVNWRHLVLLALWERVPRSWARMILGPEIMLELHRHRIRILLELR
jgi:hypothetical protein